VEVPFRSSRTSNSGASDSPGYDVPHDEVRAGSHESDEQLSVEWEYRMTAVSVAVVALGAAILL
jgi:hypothetical protein